MFKNRLIKYLFLLIISLFSAHENLNADTLDEILKLTFSTNKQLILSRTNLESSKRSIEISKSALGIDLTASFNGARDWDFSNSQNNDSYIYEYRDGSNFKLMGTPRNTAGWTTVEVVGHIIEKIGPILATKYNQVN